MHNSAAASQFDAQTLVAPTATNTADISNLKDSLKRVESKVDWVVGLVIGALGTSVVHLVVFITSKH